MPCLLIETAELLARMETERIPLLLIAVACLPACLPAYLLYHLSHFVLNLLLACPLPSLVSLSVLPLSSFLLHLTRFSHCISSSCYSESSSHFEILLSFSFCPSRRNKNCCILLWLCVYNPLPTACI
ncbi:hypothetical protein GYMLUDRAFT_507078 [Collybiopsis luxurians FD-317 M1]|uniref:Uncharacterized protein n=1 Tax=Collybiopsis luxurians FD-317 M1 TaxID=944289 RepID=A0A0D0CTB3_9AGAR|nr:hypothetical protein GYMLUDRAFT_507078 [Collybiopsis luxurians FD-317 M1]